MRNNSIRTRTVLVLLAISLLIMLVVGGLWVYSAYQTIKNEIVRSNLQDARLISRYVDSHIGSIARVENAVAGSPDTIEAITRDDRARLKRIGDNLNRSLPESDFIVIVDNRSNVLYHSKGATTTAFVAEGWYGEALKTHGTYVSGLYYSYSTKRYVFSVVVPVMDNGSAIGYFIAPITPDELNQAIQQELIHPERNVIVVDNRGRVVSHDNQSRVENNMDISYSMPVRQVTNCTEGVFETGQTFDGQLRIVGFSPVPISGWGVVVSTPMNVVYSQILERIIVILTLLSGGAIVIIIISYFISRYLTDPIVELANTMRSVSAGNYKVRARADRKDEIGDLSRTFNSTMDELERSVELEHAAEILRKYQLIFLQARDPMFSVDTEGRILDANTAAGKVYGYSHEELVSMSLSDLTIPAERLRLPDILSKCFEVGCVYETVHVRKDGSRFPVELSAAGTMLGNRQVIITSIRDITERKQAEKTVILAKDQAEKEKNQAIEEAQIYLDIMGHDINNLNQMSLMNLEMIKGDPGLTAREKTSIELSYNAIQSSSAIIDNVRKLQQLMTGKLKPHLVDLNEMVLDCIKEAPRPAGKTVSIVYTPRPGMLVMGIPLLKEVFCNLINNSIKFSGEEVTIEVHAGETAIGDKKYYQITIADNGYGIPDEVKPKLFSRFRRGTGKAEGKGLGLYIVRSLLDKFDGSVKAEDRVPGDYTKGSKFTVMIPAAETSESHT